METKKLGFLILGMSLILGIIMFNFISALNAQSQQMHCNPSQECREINSVLGVTHVAVGFMSFIFALGFYLLFFNKSDRDIIRRYHEERSRENKISEDHDVEEVSNDRFSLLLRPLDDNEKKVLQAIKEQEGITQSTLRFRTDLSKAKISQILSDFEKKKLVERKVKGRTYSIFLTEKF